MSKATEFLKKGYSIKFTLKSQRKYADDLLLRIDQTLKLLGKVKGEIQRNPGRIFSLVFQYGPK
jgi:hypothetical protein